MSKTDNIHTSVQASPETGVWGV